MAALSIPSPAALRGKPRAAGPVRLTGRRIYILPTRHGLLFAAFLLAMLVGSLNYGLSLGFALTFLLAGVALVAAVHTWRHLLGVTLAPVGASSAFAGDEVVFHLQLFAPSPRPGLRLAAAGAPPVELDLNAPMPVRLPVSASRRGRLPLPRLTVSTLHPLGLFRAWAEVVLPLEALVYPRPAACAPASGRTEGQAAAGGRPEGEGRDDFSGLRPWSPGDSPRQVAWKVLARGGPLASKRFTDDRHGTRLLDWDAAPGAREARIAWLARAVLDAERDGVPYVLRLPGEILGPARGADHRHACLAALALLPAEEA